MGTTFHVAPPSWVMRSWVGGLAGGPANPWMTTPWVAVVKPRSLNPVPPSWKSAAVTHVRPPSVERYSQLPADTADTTTVLAEAAAIVPESPAIGGVPTARLDPFSVSTTLLSMLPAAPDPLQSVKSRVVSGAANAVSWYPAVTEQGLGKGCQLSG